MTRKKVHYIIMGITLFLVLVYAVVMFGLGEEIVLNNSFLNAFCKYFPIVILLNIAAEGIADTVFKRREKK